MIIQQTHRFNIKSIFKKNLIAILCFITTLVSIFAFYLYRNYQNDIQLFADSQINSTINIFESLCNDLSISTTTFSKDKDIIDFVKEQNISASPTKYRYASNRCLYLTTTENHIDSVYIYSSINNYVLSNAYNSHISEFSDISWQSNLLYFGINEVDVVLRNGEYTPVLSFIAPIHLTSSKSIGAIIVNINIERLKTTLLKNTQIENIFIYNKYDTLIFSTVPEQTINISDISENIKEINSSNYRYIIQFKPHMTRPYIIPFVITAVLMFVITLIISLLISTYTYAPIKKIKLTVSAFTDDTATNNSNELNYIIENILSSVKVKKDAQEVLAKQMELLNKTTLAAMQAQINPHFLYNTLETVNVLSYKAFNGANDISKIVSNLSLMLYSSLDNASILTELSQEIYHLSLYMDIMSFRYRDNFKYHINVPTVLNGYMIPKLTLQPLVENIFLHGFKNKSFITINVYAVEYDDTIELNVVDDGDGIPYDKLCELQNMLSTNTSILTHQIGINNLNQRLRIIFNEMYTLKVESIEGEGTHITVTIPKQI